MEKKDQQTQTYLEQIETRKTIPFILEGKKKTYLISRKEKTNVI